MIQLFKAFGTKIQNFWKKLDTDSAFRKKVVIIIIAVNTLILVVLAYFRFAVYDEKLFLHETVMMSEILKQGKWIGNYGVGVHGFLFKLPVALIFILTGPNIYIATLFHVLLSSLTVWFFYKILEENLALKKWSVLAVVLFITNFSFLSYSITYHRDMPVLFALILFTYFILKENKRYFLNGILLMLVLDAKEYVFFAVLAPLGLYYFLQYYCGIRTFFASGLKALRDFVLTLAPSAVYLFLMFYTSLIPINMFNASILGLTTSGWSYQARHVLPENSLADMGTYALENQAYQSVQNSSNVQTSEFSRTVFVVLGTFIGYLEKFLYVVNYSFQGIPLVVLIPSVITSVYLFVRWRKKNKKLLFMNLFYWIYLLIYMIRSSHQRYILTVIPFSVVFFLFFIKESLDSKNKNFRSYFISILAVTGISSIANIFYQDIGDIKEMYNILASLVTVILIFGLFFAKKRKKLFSKFVILFWIISSVSITGFAMISKNQLYKSITWGINGETKEISEFFDDGDIIFADCKSSDLSEFTYLINIYRGNIYLPIEWHWEIDRSVVPRDLDAIEVRKKFFYYFDLEDWDGFKEYIIENDINKILLLKSEIDGVSFPLEDYIDVFRDEDWTTLNTVADMKNKKVYIFDVDYEKI